MSWIESHQALVQHPKVSDLMASMGWDLDQTIGKLHRFWWWCLDYAEDGDLRKHNDSRIAVSMGVAIPDAKRLIEAMVQSRWIDRSPYFRVHDWWDYAGPFLKKRYAKYPEKWQLIFELYQEKTPEVREFSRSTPGVLPEDIPTNQPTNQPKTQASPAAKAVVDKVWKDHHVNIYAMLGKVKRDDRHGGEIPEPVVIAVCEAFLKSPPAVKNPWPWFTRVLNAECDRYNAEKNIQEARQYKDPKRLVAGLAETMRY